MSLAKALLVAPVSLIALQSEAAVPVSGFTIEPGSTPIGLILLAVVIVGFGIYGLRSAN